MIAEFYMMGEMVAMASFFMAYLIKMEGTNRILLLTISSMMFLILGVSSFAIDDRVCQSSQVSEIEYTNYTTNITSRTFASEYSCNTDTTYDLGWAAINSFFMLISLLGIFFNVKFMGKPEVEYGK